LVIAIAMFAVAGLPGASSPPRRDAPDVRTPGSPGHFLSGGERSVLVLQEISTTLKKMDERLERIEKAVLDINKRDRGS